MRNFFTKFALILGIASILFLLALFQNNQKKNYVPSPPVSFVKTEDLTLSKYLDFFAKNNSVAQTDTQGQVLGESTERTESTDNLRSDSDLKACPFKIFTNTLPRGIIQPQDSICN